MQIKLAKYFLIFILLELVVIQNEARTTCYLGKTPKENPKRCMGGCMIKEYTGSGCKENYVVFACDDNRIENPKNISENSIHCENSCCEEFTFCNTERCNVKAPKTTTAPETTKITKEEPRMDLDTLSCYKGTLNNTIENDIVTCKTSCMAISYYSNDEKNEYYYTMLSCSENVGVGRERYCTGDICKEIEFCNTKNCNKLSVRMLPLTSTSSKVLFDLKFVFILSIVLAFLGYRGF